MKIAVIGSGGVGGYFGGRLAAVDHEVTFVARGAHFDVLQQTGLQILSPLGDLHIQPIHVVESIAEVGQVDLVLVAVKLWDTEHVAQSLRTLADDGATILSLQNGIDKDEVLERFIPPESIIGGVCYISSTIARPGVISHSGRIQRLVFGEYSGDRSRRVEDLLAACVRAGIDAEITDSIERLIWEKFVFLVGLSATTAAIRQPIGPIRENPQTRGLLLEIMQEVVTLGRATGVSLPEGYAHDRLLFCDSLPASMTSSMHHDLDRGSRLELPWLSGAVVALGRDVMIPTPLNQILFDILALYSSGRI